MEKPKSVFVVMPFGVKPSPFDGKPHDFDKIYRVVIKRAVERAGMTCIRADETAGSRMIHTDMFRDLRDQVLVIADLSLHNPNVFYEVGMRHVMSGTGTVLMCENRSLPLPFDIGLSRAVTYDYDGVSLDWEEAERLVDQLHAALQDSGPESPDSPVHALLQRVLSTPPGQREAKLTQAAAGPRVRLGELDTYIALTAEAWRKGDVLFEDVFKAHCGRTFGASALAHWVLQDETLLEHWGSRMASQLNDLAVWDLCTRVHARMHERGLSRYDDLARYASAISENAPNIAGANRALEVAEDAMRMLEAEVASDPDNADAVHARAYCKRRIAGLTQWRWELSKDPGDLKDAIAEQSASIELMRKAQKALTTGPNLSVDALANSLLKRVLLLRIQSGDTKLGDPEGDIAAVLELSVPETHNPKAASYLRWWRTIALADSGAADRVRQSALEAFSKDSDLMHKGPEFAEIGRRQYVGLRRMIDNYAEWFRNPDLIGIVGQTLQARQP